MKGPGEKPLSLEEVASSQAPLLRYSLKTGGSREGRGSAKEGLVLRWRDLSTGGAFLAGPPSKQMKQAPASRGARGGLVLFRTSGAGRQAAPHGLPSGGGTLPALAGLALSSHPAFPQGFLRIAKGAGRALWRRP